MEDTGIKIKIKIEGYEELTELKNELEAVSFLIEGLEKSSRKFVENFGMLKKSPQTMRRNSDKLFYQVRKRLINQLESVTDFVISTDLFEKGDYIATKSYIV